MLILFMILIDIGSIYLSLFYYLLWKGFFESFYDFCDKKGPAYLLIPLFLAAIISIAAFIPLFIVKTKKMVYILSGFLFFVAVLFTLALFHFTKQVQCDIFYPFEFMSIVFFISFFIIIPFYRYRFKKDYYKDYGPTLK
jgi:hypothetical protein